MPVVIDEMTTHFDVRDDAKLKKVVREEVKKAIAEERKGPRAGGPDPSDPSAGGRPNEGG